MLIIDVLEVPLSNKDNYYLLIVQDYCTKWAEEFPMLDQTANITDILISFCARMGLPSTIHSDQGHNLIALYFTNTRSHTTVYHPQGDRMVEHLN